LRPRLGTPTLGQWQLSSKGRAFGPRGYAPFPVGRRCTERSIGLAMLVISRNVSIPLEEIELNAVRAQGPGGQRVNKAATAIHLRFDIRASSLPEFYKSRLLRLSDRRVTRDGVIVIKAQGSRSQEANREAALSRLQSLIRSVAVTARPRRPTRAPAGSVRRRLDNKTRRGRTKALRRKPPL